MIMTRIEEIEKLNKAILKKTAEIKKNKEIANLILKELGVTTKTGRIRKRYKPSVK